MHYATDNGQRDIDLLRWKLWDLIYSKNDEILGWSEQVNLGSNFQIWYVKILEIGEDIVI